MPISILINSQKFIISFNNPYVSEYNLYKDLFRVNQSKVMPKVLMCFLYIIPNTNKLIVRITSP